MQFCPALLLFSGCGCHRHRKPCQSLSLEMQFQSCGSYNSYKKTFNWLAYSCSGSVIIIMTGSVMMCRQTRCWSWESYILQTVEVHWHTEWYPEHRKPQSPPPVTHFLQQGHFHSNKATPPNSAAPSEVINYHRVLIHFQVIFRKQEVEICLILHLHDLSGTVVSPLFFIPLLKTHGCSCMSSFLASPFYSIVLCEQNSFVFVSVFETGSHCVTLATIEVTM